jgi:hypothetical protein
LTVCHFTKTFPFQEVFQWIEQLKVGFEQIDRSFPASFMLASWLRFSLWSQPLSQRRRKRAFAFERGA